MGSWCRNIDFGTIVRKTCPLVFLVDSRDGNRLRTCSWDISFDRAVCVSCCCHHDHSLSYRIFDRFTGCIFIDRSSPSETHINNVDTLFCCVFEGVINSIGRAISLLVTNFESDEFNVGIDADNSLLIESCTDGSGDMSSMLMIVVRAIVIVDEIVARYLCTDTCFEVRMIWIDTCIYYAYLYFILLL